MLSRILAAVAAVVALAFVGFLALSYVKDAWGDIGVAIVVIAIFLTFIFVVVAVIFALFGLGLAHIWGKAAGPGAVVEVARTMRAGFNADRATAPKVNLLEDMSSKSLPWPEASSRTQEYASWKPIHGGGNDDDEITIGR